MPIVKDDASYFDHYPQIFCKSFNCSFKPSFNIKENLEIISLKNLRRQNP